MVLIIFLGCSKCFKEFVRVLFGDKFDFLGFDRESWELWFNEDYWVVVEKVY